VDQIEIKMGETVSGDFFKGLKFFSALHKDIRYSYLVYGGRESYLREGVNVMSWHEIDALKAGM